MGQNFVVSNVAVHDISKRKKSFRRAFRIRPVSLGLCAAEIDYRGMSAA
jgi:hypothetical protein